MAAPKEFSIAQTFSIAVNPNLTIIGKEKPVEGESIDYIPASSSNYYFRPELLSDILAWWKIGNSEGLFLTGPTGSGKTSIILEVAARINYPVQRVIGHSRLELPELCGQWIVKNGNMTYVHGPLAMAMKKGQLFLIDEVDLLDPAVLVGLNMILDGAPLTIPENGGEVINPAPGFRFVCTGNSTGDGDTTGKYQGVLAQNMALLDRMWVVNVEYAHEEAEAGILSKNFPNIPELILGQYVQCAADIRRGHESELGITMSTRVLIRWIGLSSFFKSLSGRGINPVYYALDRAILFRANMDDKDTVRGIVQRVFGFEPETPEEPPGEEEVE